MSKSWHFKCLACEERNEESLNKGDKALLSVLEHVDDIRSLLGSDEAGYIEISILGMGTGGITFLMEHYGDGHDVVVESEYGDIRRVGEK